MPPKNPNPAESKSREQLHRIESLLLEFDKFKDPEPRAHTKEIVHALMEFHSTALTKMLDQIAATPTSGVTLIDTLAANPAITPLLLLYNLHPLDLESRVHLALEKARPYLHSHGGDVQLLQITKGAIHLKLHGSCHGCPSSAITLKQTLEEALNEFAPDATSIHVEQEPEPAIPLNANTHSIPLPILAV